MDDIDIYLAANIILTRFGPENALLYCARQAEEMAEAGDMEGRRTWERIADAVRELAREPGDDDSVN